MKISSYFEIVFRCTILIYLNFLFECCNRIHAWLYADSPYLTIVLSKVGVSWVTCYISTFLLVISLFCLEVKCTFDLFLNFLIFVIFGSICFLLVIVFNSVVPMVAGFYPFYPSKVSDYLMLIISTTICAVSIRVKMRRGWGRKRERGA